MGRNELSISGCKSVQQETYSPRILGPRDEVAGGERERRPAFLPTAVASPSGWEDLDSDLKGARRALRAHPQVGERPLAPGLRAGMGEAGRGGGGGAGGGVLGSGARGVVARSGSASASAAAAGGMASTASEIIAFMVSISGWVLVSSTLPTDYWKVSTIDGTVITTATYWANLWKTCVTDSTGVSNCKDFPSMLALDGLHPLGPHSGSHFFPASRRGRPLGLTTPAGPPGQTPSSPGSTPPPTA